MLCYAMSMSMSVSVYLSARSPETPLPQLVTRSQLKPPAPSLPSSSSSSASPPPYSYWEYSVNSSLRFPASQTSFSCSWTVGWILKERLLEQVFRCKNKKGKGKKMKENSPPKCLLEKGSPWHLYYGQQDSPEQSHRAISIDQPR